MAKQAGDITLVGTFDDLCFYKMEGAHYVRRKSSLTEERFRKEAVFAGSRRSASRFGEGNRLASTLYRQVAKAKRVYSLFCFLKRQSILLLKEGKSLPEAEALLRDYLVSFELLEIAKPRVAAKPKAVPSASIRRTTARPSACTTALAAEKKCSAVKMFHQPLSPPFSPSVSVPVCRSSFPLLSKGGILWRSPP